MSERTHEADPLSSGSCYLRLLDLFSHWKLFAYRDDQRQVIKDYDIVG